MQLLANAGYVLTPEEMRLRLEPTRYQPNATASIAPLSVANDCDRGEFLLDGAFCWATGVPGVCSVSEIALG
jgi:hypothetical protein